MTSSPPFPLSGQYIASVRSTARKVREAANIKINTAAIDNLLTTVPQATFDRLKHQHGVSFPLRFTSLEDEVNFLAVLSLLNTLSGYREPFHTATGSGAYQNVVKLLFGLYITQPAQEGGESLLSSRGLASLTAETVEQIWGVSSYTEKAHESLPGVTVGERGGDMHDVVQLVVACCNETGQILLDAGYESLGQYVMQVIGEAEGKIDAEGDLVAADHIVEKIVTLIPGFRDMSTVLDPPQPIYIFKKAFFLIFAIYQRLLLRRSAPDTTVADGSTTPLPRMPEPTTLPMFVDNVLPTMCLHLGLIDATESTVPALKAWALADAAYKGAQMGAVEGKSVKEGPRLTAEEAYVVRAAALDAGRVARERAAEVLCEREGLGWLRGMTEADFDGYLWSVAKDDPALRRVPRMVERDTIMY